MIWVIVAAAAGLLVLLLWQYNALVYLRQLTRNAWSDVDVFLKRRAELIPNLVTAVKAYASHERTVFEALAEARAQAMNTKGPTAERAQAESRVHDGLVRALMLVESYPELKASGNFIQLQAELIDTEKKIAAARQYYNACVRDLNTKIESFPSNLVAGLMGVKQQDFFEVETLDERSTPAIGAL